MGIFNMHLQAGIMALAFKLYSGFVVLDDWVVVNQSTIADSAIHAIITQFP